MQYYLQITFSLSLSLFYSDPQTAEEPDRNENAAPGKPAEFTGWTVETNPAELTTSMLCNEDFAYWQSGCFMFYILEILHGD